MKDKIVAAWQAKNAQKLLNQAKDDMTERKLRISPRLLIAYLISVIILYLPVAIVGYGFYLIFAFFGQITPTVFGAILLFVGWLLMPKRAKNRATTYRRNDFPELYQLLDHIAKEAGTTVPDGLHINIQMNAYMAHFRLWTAKNEWILGLGLPLWEALEPQEKIALLAHEIAHKVNEDPARNSVLGSALQVLEAKLMMLFSPRIIDDRGFIKLISELVLWLLSRLLFLVYKFILNTIYFDSQRAEYRADALGSMISGKDAFTGLLEKSTRAHLADRALFDLFPYTKNQDGKVFEILGASIAQADEDTCRDLLDRASKELQRTDQSHPPTHMRLEFVRNLPARFDKGLLHAEAVDFEKIQNELENIKDAAGKAWMQQLHAQEVNR